MQADGLLVEVARLRREFPDSLRNQFEAFFTETEKINSVIDTSNPEENENFEIDHFQFDRLSKELTRLHALNTTIPDLTAKLQRARAVLDDAPVVGKPAVDSASVTVDKLSEMETRQRQITRQMDLASRLLSLHS